MLARPRAGCHLDSLQVIFDEALILGVQRWDLFFTDSARARAQFRNSITSRRLHPKAQRRPIPILVCIISIEKSVPKTLLFGAPCFLSAAGTIRYELRWRCWRVP